MNLIKIALTGGPCAGKTTVFEAIRIYLENKGIKVITVSETATELINSGISPNDTKNIMDFQDIIYGLQKHKEEMVSKGLDIYKNEETCVMLFDRGIIDNKAYLANQAEYDYLLAKYNDSEIDLLDSYDYVINLFSLASCNEQKYNLTSNQARFENKDEAKKLDQRTAEAWIGHKNIKVFNSNIPLEEEVQLVLEHVDNIINGTVIKKLQRYTINKDKTDFSVYNDDNSKTINIKDIYLNNSTHDGLNYIITESTYKERKSYLFSIVKESENITVDLYHKKINLQERSSLLAKYGVSEIEDRVELTFIENRQPFKIKFYEDFTILELEENTLNEKLEIPNNIAIESKIKGINSKRAKKKVFANKL